jgi:hypothetical protein
MAAPSAPPARGAEGEDSAGVMPPIVPQDLPGNEVDNTLPPHNVVEANAGVRKEGSALFFQQSPMASLHPGLYHQSPVRRGRDHPRLLEARPGLPAPVSYLES